MSIDVLARAWKHSQQSGSTLLALLALSSMAHDDGVLWMRGVTVAYIGKKARTKERQTQSNLRDLERSGEIYAPPAAGRGRTTRYFVTIGLSQDEVRAVLTLEYQLPKADAARIAADIMQRQKAQQNAPFTDDTAPEQGELIEKAQRSAPFKEKVQPNAPIERKGAIQRQEKVQSSVIKGAIQRQENGTSDASGRATLDPIRHDPNHDHDDGDDARTLAFLIDMGFGAAQEFAHLPFEQTKQDYYNRKADNNQSNAMIVKAWRRNPPTKDYHYEQSRSVNAPAEQRRPSERIGERPTLPPGLKLAGRKSAEER